MLIRLLLLYGFYSTCFAVEVNQYHFVLKESSNTPGKIIKYAENFNFGTSDSAGHVRVEYWPKDSLWLAMQYPRLKKAQGESIYSKFPIWNQAWVSGPRRSFDIYLGKNKTASLTSSINVTRVSMLLPALARSIKIEHNSLNDIKHIAIDVDPSIPINPKEDARINRATWISPPPYVQNPDKTYSDQAHLSVGDNYMSLGINSSCLASDAIGKIQKMEVLMISPIDDARFSPVSLAVLELNEPVYNMVTLLDVVNKVKLAEDQKVGKGGHTFRVICTTTQGESLIKEALFEFPPPPIRTY